MPYNNKVLGGRVAVSWIRLETIESGVMDNMASSTLA